MLAYVDIDRYLHIYERPAEPPTNEPDYLLRADGKLITNLNDLVPPEECKSAVWAKLQDSQGSGGFASMPPFFIESAEFKVTKYRTDGAVEGETTYSFADAYEQVRLARWVSSVFSGDSNGSTGTGTYYPWVPVEEHTHVRPCLHRLGSAFGVTSQETIQITSNPAASRNLTYAGLSYFNPTTFDTPTKYGWQILVAGIYDIDLYVEISASGATSGGVYVAVYDSTTSGNTLLFSIFLPVGDNEFVYTTLSKRVKLPTTTTNYLNVAAQDASDAASIDVSLVDMSATLVRATG